MAGTDIDQLSAIINEFTKFIALDFIRHMFASILLHKEY
jgi:hypothetical protein